MSARTSKPAAHAEVTIDQVAKAAKVSQATVSRVLNGTAKVSPEKEKAVRKAVANHASARDELSNDSATAYLGTGGANPELHSPAL